MKETIRVFAGGHAPLCIQMAGISYCDGSYCIKRPCSEVTVLEYVCRGEGTVMVEGQPQTVGGDKVYLLLAGSDQEYASSAEDPWEKIFINLTGRLAALLPQEYGLPQQGVYDGDGLKPLFLKIAALVQSPPQEQDEAKLIGLFSEVLCRLFQRRKIVGQDEEAGRMKAFLDSNAGRMLHNGELAAYMYRSTDYCIKCFSKAYGVTPYAYHLQQKLDIACRLLRETALPVSQIADAVGYTDPQYFSGLFRRKYGMSPRAYRRLEVFQNGTF